jgi:pilus assembly protein Flp/PilA
MRLTFVGQNKNDADKIGGAYRLFSCWSPLESHCQSRVAGTRRAIDATSPGSTGRATTLAATFRCLLPVACCLLHADEWIRTTFVDFSRGIMIKLAKRFLIEDRGVTAIEYALIAGLIAAAIATMVGNIGTNINSVFTAVAAAIKT